MSDNDSTDLSPSDGSSFVSPDESSSESCQSPAHETAVKRKKKFTESRKQLAGAKSKFSAFFEVVAGSGGILLACANCANAQTRKFQ